MWGPAGMSIVIIRKDLLREDPPKFVPTYMSYKTHADNDSLYNTPNCWAIYCCGKVFKYLLRGGGLEAMEQRNEGKGRGALRLPGSEQVLHRRRGEGGSFPDERAVRLPLSKEQDAGW